MPEWIPSVLTLAGLLATAAVTWWAAWRAQPTKDTAVFVDAAIDLVQPLKDDIAELRAKQERDRERIRLLERERRHLLQWAEALTRQLDDAEIVPVRFEEIRRLSEDT